jgi:hypothetical protein
MSHFTVLVIGNNYEEQLKPFQENNMGDCPKEYMIFHNVNDEMVKSYKEDTIPKVVMPNGALVYKYDEKFYTGDGFNRKHEIPEGLEIREIPVSQEYPDFQKFVTEYHGYKRDPINGLYGYYENPNQKWDWYQMGGRWTGYFKLKPVNLIESNEIIFNHLGLTLNEIQTLSKIYQESIDRFNELIKNIKEKSLK